MTIRADVPVEAMKLGGTTGITLRDHFAMHIVAGWVSDPRVDGDCDYSAIARTCYKIADAMLEERENVAF